MTVEEITERLEAARTLRFPRFDPNEHPGKKISSLEDYIGQTAVQRAELLEGLDWALEAQKALQDDWDGIEGHRAQLRRDATQNDVTQAKARIRPDTYKGLRDVKQLIESLHRQVRRFEKDYDAASRTYTLITGTA